MGITDYAQNQLGDIVYVEFSPVGSKVAQMSAMGTIEAVKAVSDMYAPVTGELIEVNDAVTTDPSVIKSSPYGDGWMVKIKLEDNSELDALLKPEKYRELTGD